MSVPRTKRQFAGAASDPAQRQITSYFSKDPNNTDTTTSSSPIPAPAFSPPLPASVQSNLLNVGMRVRKSVPEGYKTGTSYGSFSLWTDADASASDIHTTAPFPPSAGTRPIPHGSALPSRHELVPFCGIHKVGGLAPQPDTTGYWPAPTRRHALVSEDLDFTIPAIDDVPGLTSSQESVVSDAGSVPSISIISPPPAAPNRKRGFADDEADGAGGVGKDVDVPAPFARPLGLGVWRDKGEWLDGEVSPRSLAPAGWENARVMAVPRRRLGKGVVVAAAGAETVVDQENMVVDDFEEAEFLDRRYEAKMEVE